MTYSFLKVLFFFFRLSDWKHGCSPYIRGLCGTCDDVLRTLVCFNARTRRNVSRLGPVFSQEPALQKAFPSQLELFLHDMTSSSVRILCNKQCTPHTPHMGVASLTEICTQTFENATGLCVLFFVCKEPITSVTAKVPAEFLNYLHSMLNTRI
jgi:hypothetical protein